MMCFDVDGVEIVDLRAEQSNPSPKSRIISRVTAERFPSTVTGIVVHQTACNFGVSRAAVKAAGGDRDLAQQRRALNVACHALAFREGWVVWANPLERYIYHGNGFNRSTLGLEIEGHYAGLMDDPATTAVREDVRTTWKGHPDVVTELVVKTARAAIRLLVESGREQGMPIENIYAHRQSSATRRSDPGQELWQRVVLEYACPVLGLISHPGMVLGEGKPIPLAWDAVNGEGNY